MIRPARTSNTAAATAQTPVAVAESPKPRNSRRCIMGFLDPPEQRARLVYRTRWLSGGSRLAFDRWLLALGLWPRWALVALALWRWTLGARNRLARPEIDAYM